MLDWRNKQFIKIISILAIYSFLSTSMLYPESINNKDIAGIYTIEDRLRVPMAFGKTSEDQPELNTVSRFVHAITLALHGRVNPLSFYVNTIYKNDDFIQRLFNKNPKELARRIKILKKAGIAPSAIAPPAYLLRYKSQRIMPHIRLLKKYHISITTRTIRLSEQKIRDIGAILEKSKVRKTGISKLVVPIIIAVGLITTSDSTINKHKNISLLPAPKPNATEVSTKSIVTEPVKPVIIEQVKPTTLEADTANQTTKGSELGLPEGFFDSTIINNITYQQELEMNERGNWLKNIDELVTEEGQVEKIYIDYENSTVIIYINGKYYTIPAATARQWAKRWAPGTKLYIYNWHALISESKIPYSENRENPYGPFLAKLSLSKDKYVNPSSLQLHGTSGPYSPSSSLGVPEDTFLTKEGTRRISHGCTRLPNIVIGWLRKHAPRGTPLEVSLPPDQGRITPSSSKSQSSNGALETAAPATFRILIGQDGKPLISYDKDDLKQQGIQYGIGMNNASNGTDRRYSIDKTSVLLKQKIAQIDAKNKVLLDRIKILEQRFEKNPLQNYEEKLLELHVQSIVSENEKTELLSASAGIPSIHLFVSREEAIRSCL